MRFRLGTANADDTITRLHSLSRALFKYFAVVLKRKVTIRDKQTIFLFKKIGPRCSSSPYAVYICDQSDARVAMFLIALEEHRSRAESAASLIIKFHLARRWIRLAEARHQSRLSPPAAAAPLADTAVCVRVTSELTYRPFPRPSKAPFIYWELNLRRDWMM